tara:strand:- start:12 stop:575 length:564 start_codon:yes stop_codon:yes gene_type:complete
MVEKIKTCIFISGKGSNLKSIIKSSREYNFPIKIELIISDNKNAKGIFIAKKYSIPFKFFSGKNKKTFERNCLFEIKKRKIKFLCLAGFMKILSESFIKSFGYKIINIHPSLLPKYKGLNTHKRALDNKEKYSGCTVHFVTPDLDSGKIISQKKVLIAKNETENTLRKKILAQEHKLYPRSIISIFK